MPHYFLHLRDGADEVLDPEGSTFPTFAKLVEAVRAAARELIAHGALCGEIDFGYRIDAESEGGIVVHTLSFRDAVRMANL
ncbi:hypothetical protein [Phenylobacterium sp.]|uniref:DUF6894 family protein n=1 Tax=Phenylobacterium sp. TaxID=1871053 RepID=UPI0035B01875